MWFGRSTWILLQTIHCVPLVCAPTGFEQYSAFDYQRCEHNSHSSVVAVYVYVALSTYLPGTLIFVSNVMLFLRLRRSDSLRRSLFGKPS